MRLDEYLKFKKLVNSRHQANDLIKRKQVKVNGQIIDQPAYKINPSLRLRILLKTQPYATRGGDKLQAALLNFKINLKDKIVLDVGAHVGGFTEVALRHRARLIIAVDVGKQTLSPFLQSQKQILSFPKTDIRDFKWPTTVPLADFILVDVAFVSLTKILNHLLKFAHPKTLFLVLAKPQFETLADNLQKGVVKNQAQRRQILNQLQTWFLANDYLILNKNNAAILGQKGNWERFYLLRKL